MCFTGKDARFRGNNQETVRGQHIACGTEPIAIQSRTNDTPIAESESCWTIPRFDKTCMILAPCSLSCIQFGIFFPGGRYQHLHTVQQVTSRVAKQLQCIVELSRIATTWLYNGQEVLYSLSPQWRVQATLTRLHPVPITLKRIDFTVVGKQSHR